MSERKRTPGRWHVATTKFFNVSDDRQYLVVHDDAGTASICKLCASEGEEGRYYAMPDALLIAAAPEMLEALEDCLKTIESEMQYILDNGRLRSMVQAAIAKAKGDKV